MEPTGQLCDLHVPEIEEMLEVTPHSEACDERHGWFPAHVEEECRRILSHHILEAFNRQDAQKKKAQKSNRTAEEPGPEEEEEAEEDEIEEEMAEEEDEDETNLHESLDESSSSDDAMDAL